ncbi:hypothetical protein ILYODFUR_036578, partial [Ilyodon furcidens]
LACRDSVSTGDFSGTQFASAGLRERSPCVTRVEEAGCSKSGTFIWTVMSQEVRSYPVSCLCRK